MRRTLIALLLLPLVAAAASAQGESSDSAAVAARSILRALARSDFRYVAQRSNPAELSRLRADFDSLLRADSANYLGMRIFRMDSTAQVLRLGDIDFASRLMAFEFGINPAFRALATITDIDIPGTVRRGSDSALVIYRWVYPPDSPPMETYNVERMIRCGSDWCVESPGNFSGLLRLLKQPMVPARGSKPPRR